MCCITIKYKLSMEASPVVDNPTTSVLLDEEDEDRKKFLAILADAKLIDKPIELHHSELMQVKQRLDGVRGKP